MAAVGLSKMKLEIELQGADPAVVIPQLQALLFFPDLDTAIAGLPNLVAHMLPAAVDKTHPTESPTKPTCDCYHIFKDGNWIDVEKSVSKYTNPVVIKMAEPNFSQEARDKKISGSVSLYLHV
jgi:hypothetical protein